MNSNGSLSYGVYTFTHTHARIHTRMHNTHAHTRTHTHTHTQPHGVSKPSKKASKVNTGPTTPFPPSATSQPQQQTSRRGGSRHQSSRESWEAHGPSEWRVYIVWGGRSVSCSCPCVSLPLSSSALSCVRCYFFSFFFVCQVLFLFLFWRGALCHRPHPCCRVSGAEKRR